MSFDSLFWNPEILALSLPSRLRRANPYSAAGATGGITVAADPMASAQTGTQTAGFTLPLCFQHPRSKRTLSPVVARSLILTRRGASAGVATDYRNVLRDCGPP